MSLGFAALPADGQVGPAQEKVLEATVDYILACLDDYEPVLGSPRQYVEHCLASTAYYYHVEGYRASTRVHSSTATRAAGVRSRNRLHPDHCPSAKRR